MSEAVAIRPSDTALMRLDPSELIAKAIDAGAGIETMERLVALAKDMRAQLARDAWHEAMAQFQAACPSIRRTKRASIRMRAGGSYSYSYAPLDEILGVIQPVMGPLGLSVSWRQRMEEHRVVVSCRISHTLGHYEESGEIAMPIIATDPETGANPAQRVGIATTYAKRYSLLGIVGMAPEDDPDAAAGPEKAAPEANGPHHQQSAAGAISENQGKRAWAIARGAGWKDEEVAGYLIREGIESGQVADIPRARYEAIVEALRAGTAPRG
jgi:hypothetical protein